jgi:hypothetical protein
MHTILIGALMFLVATGSPAFAETPPENVSDLVNSFKAGAPTNSPQQPAGNEDDVGYSLLRVAEEDNRRLLALCIMGTAIIALGFVLTVLLKRGAPAETVVAGSGLVLVIFATVLVAVLAKSDQQLTAPIGILGAIAGYMFGKAGKGAEAEQKQTKVDSQ